MQNTSPVILTIIAVILVLLFIGILFLVMLLYHNQKRKKIEREKQMMKAAFEKQILESRLEMQEQTFNTISQEIHDNVGQTLSLAKLQLNILMSKELTDYAPLLEVKETLGFAMTDLRDIAKSLSTDRIKSFDLHDNITHHISRINKSGAVNCVFNSEGIEQRLDDQLKLVLFRIIQESLQNIIKHGNASNIQVHFSYAERLCVTIHDDGIGFDPEIALKKKTGLGLQNIINRTRMAGGEASITSAIGKGSTIKIQLPYGR